MSTETLFKGSFTETEIEDAIIASALLKLTTRETSFSNQMEALLVINYAILEENELDATTGPFRYWWTYVEDGTVSDCPLRHKYEEPEFGLHFHPYQYAKSRQVIRKVVDKLGTEIFRIAAGVPKQ